MEIDLRLPNITGKTDHEQLAQIKSYLFQLVGQLQWALQQIDTATVQNDNNKGGHKNAQEKR